MNNMAQATPRGALQGLRIVDLSRVLSGPYCTQILADHGASVLKVEPPTGDETRTWGPPFLDDVASYFQGVNRNKRAMCLDLSQPEGRDRVLELLARADVLVENFKTGTMGQWGLAYEEIAHRFPRLIYCSISGFGSDGPLGGLPGYDAAVQAMSGIMSVNGEPDSAPTRVGIPIVDLVTGLNATIGITMALHERERSGRGQHVELSLFDCALSILHPHTANFLASGKVPRRTGNAHPNIAPYETVSTRTTPIFLAVGNERQFQRLCEVLGAPQLAEQSKFRTNRDRSTNRVELSKGLAALMRDHDGQELADRLMKAGVPCSSVFDVNMALNHPHTQHRGMLVRIEDYQGIASPIRLARTPATYRQKPPRLDEHQFAFDFLDSQTSP